VYIRGFDVDTESVTITSVVGGDDGRTQIVKIDGEDSFMGIAKAETTSERGLKSFETEQLQEELANLRITLDTPKAKSACADNLPEPTSYLEIDDGKRTGIVYFCDGVGVDEAGNISGPYHDLLEALNELKIESA